MMSWVRLWLDMPTDPKWRVIARKSGQSLPCVIALYTYMLTIAGGADRPGSISDLSVEEAAAALDMDEDAVSSILDAMESRVTEAGRLSGWEKRQPKREDDSSQRVREHRERKRNEKAIAAKRSVTHGNAPEADADTEAASAANAPARDEAGNEQALSLTIRLCKAAGIEMPDPGRNFARHGEYLGLVAGWLKAGADPAQLERSVAARAASMAKKAQSLRYFDGAVRDMIAGQSSTSPSDGCDSLVAEILARKAAKEAA